MKIKFEKVKKFFIDVLSTALIILIVIGVGFSLQRAKTMQIDVTDVEIGEFPDKKPLLEEGYAELTEVRMHYLRYGDAEKTVILIHGNGGSAASLVCIAQYLANDYTVYCIADRCQGKSSDPGVINYELMAKDVFEFISLKNLQKPYVAGHSDGGMVAIALAANYPDSVKGIVSFGANSNPAGLKFYFKLGVRMNNLFPDKLNDMMLDEPDFNEEYLSRIVAPTYIVAGERDIMYTTDIKFLHEHIKGSKLLVVKNADHSGYVVDGRGYFIIKRFFEEI